MKAKALPEFDITKRPLSDQDLKALIAITQAFSGSSCHVRRRLRRGIEALRASQDRRYLEQLDVKLSEPERTAKDLEAEKEREK